MNFKLKLESDIHNGIFRHYTGKDYEPNLEGIDVYVLAGDVDEGVHSYYYCKKLLEKYPDLVIIHVSGNHEGYDSTPVEELNLKLNSIDTSFRYFHLVAGVSIVVKGVRFIGDTLWTDYNKGNVGQQMLISRRLNDYRYITYIDENLENEMYPNPIRTLTTKRVLKYHREAKKSIFKELAISDIPTIVVTHHQPYVSEWYSELKYGFEVDLKKEMKKCKNTPLYWFHGHTHQNQSVEIEGFRIISNQLGYPWETDIGFDPNFCIDVEV